MKKLSVFSLLVALAIPAYATEIDTQNTSVETENITEQIEPQKSETTKSETAFPHGIQIGVGLSATSGLNGFVGYANKDFDSFWAKRFGVRFDFASTKPVKSLINNGIDSIMGDDGIDVGDT